MRKDTFVMVIGGVVFLLPFLGIPTLWKDIAQFVLGAALVLTAVACRIEHRRSMRTASDTLHVEHDPYGSTGVHSV
jgi:hypothetical protein